MHGSPRLVTPFVLKNGIKEMHGKFEIESLSKHYRYLPNEEI